MERSYIDGGPDQPFGDQHPDDRLPVQKEIGQVMDNIEGSGDQDAMADYIAGRRHGSGHPIGGSQTDFQKMSRHGVRQARRQAGRQAKSGKPPKVPGLDSSAHKTGY